MAGAQPFDVRYPAGVAVQLHLRSAIRARTSALLDHMPRVLDAVVGGWKTNGVWRMNDGRPLTMTSRGWKWAADVRWGEAEHRRNAQAKPRYRLDRQLLRRSERVPASGRLHAGKCAARNRRACGHRGHSTSIMSLSKQFVVHEEMSLEFRIEARNAFNHPVFGTPDTSWTIPASGR